MQTRKIPASVELKSAFYTLACTVFELCKTETLVRKTENTQAPNLYITYWAATREAQIKMANMSFCFLWKHYLCLIRPLCCFCFLTKPSVVENPLKETNDDTNFLYASKKGRSVEGLVSEHPSYIWKVKWLLERKWTLYLY